MPLPRTAPGSSNRSFGLIFAVVFAIVGLLPLLSRAPIRPWAMALSVLFLLLALALPHVLAPLNVAWTAFGDVLHRIVSPIALGVVFFGAVFPTGLLLRLFGKDPLRLRLEPAAKSYWIAREPGPEPESLKNQF